MDEIKRWAFSVCCAAISGGIVGMIFPEGKTGRIFKTVFCVFFLSVILSPLSEIRIPDFIKSYDPDSESAGYNYDEENEFFDSSAEFIESKILADTENILMENGLMAKDIFVSVNISENGSIDINKFALIFDETGNLNEIENILYEKTGIKPEIIISGEE